MKRRCYNCQKHLPPETEHFIHDNEVYCTDCLKAEPYTAHLYYLDGEFLGTSEDDSVDHIESYEDEYEEEE